MNNRLVSGYFESVVDAVEAMNLAGGAPTVNDIGRHVADDGHRPYWLCQVDHEHSPRFGAWYWFAGDERTLDPVEVMAAALVESCCDDRTEQSAKLIEALRDAGFDLVRNRRPNRPIPPC